MSSIMNKEFTIKPTYELNNNYIKSKIREFRDIITTDFLKNKIPKEKTPYKCLSLIKLESILRIKKNYCYSQIFLEECKYGVKNIKRNSRIDCDFEKSSSDQSDNEADSETDSDPDINPDDNNDSDNNESNQKTVF